MCIRDRKAGRPYQPLRAHDALSGTDAASRAEENAGGAGHEERGGAHGKRGECSDRKVQKCEELNRELSQRQKQYKASAAKKPGFEALSGYARATRCPSEGALQPEDKVELLSAYARATRCPVLT
eukprot:3875960-Rhodomonas_salina.1